VCLHRADGDEQPLGDLGVGQPPGHQPHHVQLPGRQVGRRRLRGRGTELPQQFHGDRRADQGLAGGSVSGDAFPSINGILRRLQQPLGADNTTAYISFLLRPEGTLNSGIFNGFFGLTLNGSLGNDLFVGKPGGGLLDRYVIETRGGSGQLASNTETVVGRTALMVVKAQFMPGVDIFTLYTNPLPNRPEPAKGLVKSDIDLGVVSAIGIYSTGAFSIDEIRIGTTYADVLPTSHPGGRDLFEGCDDDDRDEHHRR